MKLPVVSGQAVVTSLTKAGFEQARQNGSHVAMVRREPDPKTVIVPLHKELDRGTLRAIIRQADLTVEQFLDLL